MLQEDGELPSSDFELEVALVYVSDGMEDENDGLVMFVIVVALIVVTSAIAFCFICFAKKRRGKHGKHGLTAVLEHSMMTRKVYKASLLLQIVWIYHTDI